MSETPEHPRYIGSDKKIALIFIKELMDMGATFLVQRTENKDYVITVTKKDRDYFFGLVDGFFKNPS